MARPRKATDDEIFQAAYRVMQRLGPAQWTLADIAGEAGLTPGALVQRFGSKRTLQIVLIARYADAVPEMYTALRKRHRAPLAALRAYANQVGCLASSPAVLAHHLDYLRLDLTDPDMHPHFRRQAEVARAFLGAVIEEAVARGDLRRGTDTAVLAGLVETVIAGALFTWAAYQEGHATDWMRRSLDALLAPYLVRKRRSAGSRRAGS